MFDEPVPINRDDRTGNARHFISFAVEGRSLPLAPLTTVRRDVFREGVHARQVEGKTRIVWEIAGADRRLCVPKIRFCNNGDAGRPEQAAR